MSQQSISGKVDVGVRINLHPEDPTDFIHVQRSGDGTTSTIEREFRVPGTFEQVQDTLPPTAGTKFYRTRGIGRTDCVSPSSWTDWRQARASVGLGNPERPKIPIGREVPREAGGANVRDVVRNIFDSGKLSSNALMGTTGNQFGVNRHTEKGVDRNGSTITFSNSYENPPKVTFTPQSAISFHSTFGGIQRIDYRATNLTAAGFTLTGVVKSTTGQSSTSITDGFSSTQNTGAPENGDVTLTADGEAAYSNLEDANDNEATYQGFYDISTTGLGRGESASVHFEVNDGSTSTTWDDKDAKVYSDGEDLSDESLSFTDILNTNYDVRLRLSLSAGASGASVTAHGEDNATPGVQYEKVTSAAVEKNATPDATDGILWEAKDTA